MTASSGPGGLWDTQADINRFDIVLLSCEGSETTNPNSPVLAQYVNAEAQRWAGIAKEANATAD